MNESPMELNLPDERILRVRDLTRLIRSTLEEAFGQVWVEGEISNLRQPGSGHLYFTLKDEAAQIDAVLFRGDQRHLAAPLQNGQRVQVFGAVTVYEPQGRYQVVVRRVRPAGQGSLQEQFEALKKRLAAEGLFDEARKKPLPLLPRRIGIVTSPTGAAIRDILNILNRRFPNLHIQIAPVRVQGAGSAAEIAAAIRLFNEQAAAEVLIVGRGGGSIEDLWAFNEEIVARAMAASSIPVISAVGHETDFTIADFVADLRAPTPSAAAELVVGRRDAFEERLAGHRTALRRLLKTRWLELSRRLAAVRGHYTLAHPHLLLRPFRQRMDTLRGRLIDGARTTARQAAQRVDLLHLTLPHLLRRRMDRARAALDREARRLTALNPTAVLQRGYSITWDADGRVLTEAGALRPGAILRTRLARGLVESEVIQIQVERPDGGTAHEPEKES